jgi:hypothetical protein
VFTVDRVRANNFHRELTRANAWKPLLYPIGLLMNWMLWTTLMVTAAFLLRFGWHYRMHLQNGINRSYHSTRTGEYQGPPLSLSFRYRDGNQGPWRLVSAQIVEVVRYGDGLFLKGLEGNSLGPRVYDALSLKDLRELPLGTPVALSEILSRVKPPKKEWQPPIGIRELPAIYRQA